MKANLKLVAFMFVLCVYRIEARWNFTGNCPFVCECIDIEWSETEEPFATVVAKVVDCSKAGLNEVPVLPNDTQVLVLDSNEFTNISKVMESISIYKGLKDISLSRNFISSFEIDGKYPNIERLTVNDNKIEKISFGFLKSCPNLREFSAERNSIQLMLPAESKIDARLRILRLDSNKIERLGWLKSITGLEATLQILTLGGNQLIDSRLNENLFSTFPALSALIIGDMGLEEISEVAFSNLKLLETLELDNNKLRGFPVNAFTPLNSLRTLNLNENLFSEIAAHTFENMTSLESVEVTRQPLLRLVDDGAFSRLPRLNAVLLSHNPRLAYVAPGTFRGCPLLRTLDLQSTSVEILSEEVKKDLPALKDIYMKNNPVNCNCMMMWMKEWSEAPSESEAAMIDGNNRIVCSSPPQYRGSYLSEVQAESSTCAPSVEPTFPLHVNLDYGERLEIKCRSFGNPKPDIFWVLPNGITVSNNTEANVYHMKLEKDGTLSSIQVIPGEYTCIASNLRGMASRKVLVKVKPETTKMTKDITTDAAPTISTTSTEEELEHATTEVAQPSTKTAQQTQSTTTTTTAAAATVKLNGTKQITTASQPKIEETTESTLAATKASQKSTQTTIIKKLTTTTTTMATATTEGNESEPTEEMWQAPLTVTTDRHKVLTTAINSIYLPVPDIDILKVKATSALITWTTADELLSLHNQQNLVMMISLEHNNRIIYKERVQPAGIKPDWELQSPEYNISLLESDQLYKICLTVKCCQGLQENHSCTQMHTAKTELIGNHNLSAIATVLISLMIVVLAGFFVAAYGMSCKPFKWGNSQYQYLGLQDKQDQKHIIPMSELYPPLMANLPNGNENAKATDCLIDTQTSFVYT